MTDRRHLPHLDLSAVDLPPAEYIQRENDRLWRERASLCARNRAERNRAAIFGIFCLVLGMAIVTLLCRTGLLHG